MSQSLFRLENTVNNSLQQEGARLMRGGEKDEHQWEQLMVRQC